VELALAPVLCLVGFALLMRPLRLMSSEDVAVAARLHPFAGRLAAALARPAA
jgi:hypothetical protein